MGCGGDKGGRTFDVADGVDAADAVDTAGTGDTGDAADTTTAVDTLDVIPADTADSSTGDLGAETDTAIDTTGSGLGSSQIGVGRAHDPAWVTHYGGPGDEEAWALGVSAAGVFIGGQTTSDWFKTFDDTCAATGDDEGDDCGDAFALNTGSGAGLQFGTPQTDTVRGIAADAGAVYIAGTVRQSPPGYRKDAWVMAYPHGFGQRRWDYRISSENKVDELLDLVLDGDLFISGGSAGRLTEAPQAGDEDAFVLRLTTAGSAPTILQFGSPQFEELMGLAVDDDHVYLAGQTGGYLGEGNGTNLGKTDVLLVIEQRSLAASDEICRVQFGTSGKDVGQAVEVVGGFVYVAGWTEGVMNADLPNGGECNQDDFPPTDAVVIDAFVAKYDLACNHVWTRQFGSKSGDSIDGLASDGTHLFLAGTTGGTSDHAGLSGTDGFLRAYDLEGELAGEILFASSGDGTDTVRSVVVYDGFIYVAGQAGGDLGVPGSSKGGADAWVGKIPLGEALRTPVTDGSGCR